MPLARGLAPTEQSHYGHMSRDRLRKGSRASKLPRGTSLPKLDAQVVHQTWETLPVGERRRALHFTDAALVHRLYSVHRILCFADVQCHMLGVLAHDDARMASGIDAFAIECSVKSDGAMKPLAFFAKPAFAERADLLEYLEAKLGGPLLTERPFLQPQDWPSLLEPMPSSWSDFALRVMRLVELAVGHAHMRTLAAARAAGQRSGPCAEADTSIAAAAASAVALAAAELAAAELLAAEVVQRPLHDEGANHGQRFRRRLQRRRSSDVTQQNEVLTGGGSPRRAPAVPSLSLPLERRGARSTAGSPGDVEVFDISTPLGGAPSHVWATCAAEVDPGSASAASSAGPAPNQELLIDDWNDSAAVNHVHDCDEPSSPQVFDISSPRDGVASPHPCTKSASEVQAGSPLAVSIAGSEETALGTCMRGAVAWLPTFSEAGAPELRLVHWQCCGAQVGEFAPVPPSALYAGVRAVIKHTFVDIAIDSVGDSRRRSRSLL